jgi:hypothetical protein
MLLGLKDWRDNIMKTWAGVISMLALSKKYTAADSGFV